MTLQVEVVELEGLVAAVACHRDRLEFRFGPLPEPRQNNTSYDGRRLTGPAGHLLSALPKGVALRVLASHRDYRVPSIRSEELSHFAVLTKTWT